MGLLAKHHKHKPIPGDMTSHMVNCMVNTTLVLCPMLYELIDLINSMLTCVF